MRSVAVDWGRRLGFEASGPVSIAQRAMSEANAGIDGVVNALDAILEQSLWADVRNTKGTKFPSFAEFVVALPPVGLGVRSMKPMKVLRAILLELGRYAPFVEVMERTLRPEGRPRKTVANGEGFVRFYPYPKTQTSRDYMLLALKQNHPEQFLELCKLKGSIRQAAINAGVITSTRKNALRHGVCDLQAAQLVPDPIKPKVMRELFRELGLGAQCTFLKGLEPVLGPDLARRWRAHHSTPPTV
jgi:hypothetical protein